MSFFALTLALRQQLDPATAASEFPGLAPERAVADYVLANVLVLLAVKEAPLSRVAPAREVSMLFAALLGGQLLGEQERGWRLAGAALAGFRPQGYQPGYTPPPSLDNRRK